jgi:glycerophosphoryl diester phosphodiesterase
MVIRMNVSYPRIIAHRCGGALAPENSLSGLAIAARLGCRGVEFDVMLTKDGIPILIHDETLERTTTGRGKVADLTLAEIQRFDAGGPHHKAFAVSPAPTFEEAMACCSKFGLWANIEIKPAAGFEEVTGATIGRWLASCWNGHGVVSSFSEIALRAAYAAAPEAGFGWLVDALPIDWPGRMASMGVRAIHLSANKVTPETAEQLGDIPWACYTVNRHDIAEGLFALGCTAVITDRPDLWSTHEM